ncbi:MAG TPA: 30S ribosome-binding factor RbfA [Alphaproteobacteria bacterium]|nr:30S ribosome-binding factor RbfA [Alphaproteobacteria bacterium]
MTRHRGSAPSQRQLRVGEEIRHAIAALIERGAMKDPELRDVPVTVTEVRTSPDLRHAHVFVVPLGGGDSERIVAALNRAAPYFRAKIASSVRLKFAPDVVFAADTSFEQASKIDSILRRSHVKRDLEADEGGDEDDGG